MLSTKPKYKRSNAEIQFFLRIKDEINIYLVYSFGKEIFTADLSGIYQRCVIHYKHLPFSLAEMSAFLLGYISENARFPAYAHRVKEKEVEISRVICKYIKDNLCEVVKPGLNNDEKSPIFYKLKQIKKND